MPRQMKGRSKATGGKRIRWLNRTSLLSLNAALTAVDKSLSKYYVQDTVESNNKMKKLGYDYAIDQYPDKTLKKYLAAIYKLQHNVRAALDYGD